MKIENFSISMSGKSLHSESLSQEQSLKTWNNSIEAPNTLVLLGEDSLDISQEGKLLSMQKNNTLQNKDVFELPDKEEQKIKLIEQFIQSLTGKKIKLIIPTKIHLKTINQQNIQNGITIQRPSQNPLTGKGLEYNFTSTYHEKQSMSFNSAGIVKTSDGREINFSFSLNVAREFINKESVNIQLGSPEKKDPLVINFDRPSALLTDNKISFDIDYDGKSDQISTLAQGSGFLSLDINNDGKINDGSELFGTRNNDGFADLAKYDQDNNGWIDENDDIFDKLRIWVKDEDDNDVLFALGEKGIGAIYLGNVNTDFALKNNQNVEQGEIRKTGIFLKEDGGVGTIQHLDLVV